jgi:DNA-binding XRE family transcriptional regulator
MKDIDAKAFGERLAERRDVLGMTQDALGRAVGYTQQTIQGLEIGKTKRPGRIVDLAEALQTSVEWLLYGEGSGDGSIAAPASAVPSLGAALSGPIGGPLISGPVSRDRTMLLPGRQLMGEKDLPVHASAQGGKGALVISSEPVDWAGRPEPLARVKDGYGIIVSENSMSPEFESGDIALVHPHKPPITGRTCVFYAERDDGTVEACIKRLRKETADAWHVTQFNPPDGEKRDYVLKKAEWQKCHVTVGSYKGR